MEKITLWKGAWALVIAMGLAEVIGITRAIKRNPNWDLMVGCAVVGIAAWFYAHKLKSDLHA